MPSHSDHINAFVSAREELVSIPTYPVREADNNPIFYYGRGYQGAKGRVYPYPLLDKLSDIPQPKNYHAIILENSYIELMILPEIGGRIFSAKDKTNGYDFLYRQSVIKPVLIGMVGAWISGGAEWNIPHHHRTSTFMPIDHRILENEDGSKTVWMTEIEQRHHMKWTLGITLFPDRSCFEVKVKLFNRTPLAQSFLYFTNAAVHANVTYQVIFPPRTQWGTQHAKCEFISWPIGQGKYAGIDYTGIDVSWWKNHPNPISIFAWNDRENFFGGYDHGKRAGVVRVADRHVSPGMKFFEFGNGNAGRMWDTILTDSDGPYVELMSGSYSDNQPDYSWIEPYEVREAAEYWYPVRDLGAFQNANRDAALSLGIKNGFAEIGFNVTHPIDDAAVRLMDGETTLYEKRLSLSPDHPFRESVPYAEKAPDLHLTLQDKSDAIIIEYHITHLEPAPMPAPVTPPSAPRDIASIEELYLTGLRLEQFHNPALNAVDYYMEALSRDPGDSSANMQMGILHLKNGEYDRAETALRIAVKRITEGYTRPKNGEPLYYLGLALRAQDKRDEAKETFLQCVCSQAWRAAGYYQLAEMQAEEGDYDRAKESVEQSLMMNGFNTRAYCLKSAILRRLGDFAGALGSIQKSLTLDPLDYRALNEKVLIQRELKQDASDYMVMLSELMDDKPHTYLELAFEYGDCGLWQDAMDILHRHTQKMQDQSSRLIWYMLGYCQEKISGVCDERSRLYYSKGKKAADHLCFPSNLHMIPVFEAAIQANQDDSRAPYYLGCLLYDHQPERAIALWERSAELCNDHPQTLRCLADGYAKQRNDTSKAMQCLINAMECDPNDPRFPLELDIIMESAGASAEERLRMLEERREIVLQRDDAAARLISLYLLARRYDNAIEILQARRFHVWEGNEGFVHSLYTDAHLLKGRTWLEGGHADMALEEFRMAGLYPQNLEMGEPSDGGRIAETSYWTGMAYEALGDSQNAMKAFRLSVINERKGSVLTYYQALSWRKLGEETKAVEILNDLISHSLEQIEAAGATAFFEKFGQKESDSKRKASLHYLCGLGRMGLEQMDPAKVALKAALQSNPNHLMAKIELEELEKTGY
jgi:tetratricopeptide (TPR) repeat protein